MGDPLRRSYSPNLAGEALLRLSVFLISAALAPRVFIADVNGYFESARLLSWDHLPYRDFLWEYPPVAAVVLLFGPLAGGSREVFVGLFATAMMALELGCLSLLRSGRPESAATMTRFWTITVVPLGSFLYFRHDFLSVFFATVALLGLVAGRRIAWAVMAGFGAKVWPAIYVVPLVGLRRYRDAASAAALSAGLVGLWAAFSPAGLGRFVEYRQGGGFEIESLLGALLLLGGRTPSFQFGSAVVSDVGWEWAHVAMAVVLVIAMVGVVHRMSRRDVDVTAAVGALVLTLILSSRILSAQYVVWLAPCVVLLWPSANRQGWLFGASAFLTLLELAVFDRVIQGELIPVLMLNARNLLLLWLWIELLRLALRRQNGPPEPRAQARRRVYSARGISSRVSWS